jgi:hypothetical protein
MNGPKSLATIVNQISDDDLAAISCDDALILYEGLLPHGGEPEVDAALARLAAYLWEDDGPAFPATRTHPRRVLH